MAGCRKTEVDIPEKKPENNVGADVNNDEYIHSYEDILAKVYALIENIDDEDGSQDGFEGVWEAAKASGGEALNEIGYVLKDISGDDVPELLIGSFEKDDDAYTNNEIYLTYTLLEDSPEIMFYGWNRNAYSLKDDNSFFYNGSSGVAYSAFGKYHISEEGESVCDDFYFTYPQEDNPEEIEIFYNTTGIFDNKKAERLDMTLDEFWELEEKMSKGTAKIKGTPFAELDEAIIEKSLLKSKAPNPNLLNGEWTLLSTEVEGEVLSKEESGLSSEINISDNNARYFLSTEYETKGFEADFEFLEEPLYYACTNDIWCIKFNMTDGDFGEDEEFYATLIDEDTLLLRHLFPFDGSQGVSHQTYTRK